MPEQAQTARSKGIKLLTDEEIKSLRESVDVRALNSQQIRAAEILAAGIGYYDTAAAVGVHHSTLARWKKLPSFQEYLEAIRENLVSDCLYRLPALFAKALDAIEDILENAGHKNRLKAAQILLRPMFKVQETQASREVEEDWPDERLASEIARVKEEIARLPGASSAKDADFEVRDRPKPI